MSALIRFIMLFAPDTKTLLKVVVVILLLPIALFTVFFSAPAAIVETIPLASPSQVNFYIEGAERVSEKYGKEIDWQELIAIDAVRLKQDFSQASPERALELAEKFIWKETIKHKSTSIGPDGKEHTHTRTEIRYHKYSLDEVLDNLGFSAKEKEKVRVFLQTDLAILRDVGSEMPEGWVPEIDELEWPVPGIFLVTSKFGPRVDPVEHLDGFHTGLDIGAGSGTQVVAAQEGQVIYAGRAGNYGKAVFIRHEKYVTRYCHLSKILVKEGKEVSKGDAIGKVGSTGKSTGPHLHFEVRDGNKALDPLKFFI